MCLNTEKNISIALYIDVLELEIKKKKKEMNKNLCPTTGAMEKG